jgi:Mg-chelatase subunit ChlD
MNNTTEIAFILDRSGSMESIAETAVKAFNELLEQQQKEHEQTPVRMSLVLFNEDCEVPFASTPAPELPRLSIKAYAPDGMTGLLDAIGRTIDETGARLDPMPEAERPGKVIIAIMTDGLENASKTFNLDQISEKIRHQRDVYKWEFLFLGANQDAIATAARMNIDHHDSVTFFQNDGSVRKSMRGTSSSLRERKMRLACMAPLSKCVEEADDKE